jgi:beta-barrel assembly-enhancing protease
MEEKFYFAVGLNSELESKRVAGKLIVYKTYFIFSYEEKEIKFSYHECTSKIGGSGDSLVFFSHPDYPEWSIYTSDKSILKDKILQNQPFFKNLANSYNTQNLIYLSMFVLLALFITGLTYSFFYFKETFTYYIASKVPISIEKKLGDTAFQSLTFGKKFYKDDKIISQLKPITDPLVEVSKSSGYTFEFHIIEDSTINAFAIPGGIIVIHSELIRRAESPEEIAGVLAHEISHVTQKHGLRQIINSIGIFVLVQTLFGDLTGLLAVFTQNSGMLLTSAFSREYEKEADAKGFHYLVYSNIDPEGMISFFNKIVDEEKKVISDETKEIISFFSTHPGTEQRIDNIKQKKNELKGKTFVKINMDLDKFKDSLK